MEYEIKGTDMPMLEVRLHQGEAMYTEFGRHVLDERGHRHGDERARRAGQDARPGALR